MAASFAAVKKSIDHKGDDGRKYARDDGLELEGLLAVEDFRREKCGPERGLEDGADPSAAPARSIVRRSLSSTFRTDARNDPKPAPICAMGPSFPADPPEPW